MAKYVPFLIQKVVKAAIWTSADTMVLDSIHLSVKNSTASCGTLKRSKVMYMVQHHVILEFLSNALAYVRS